LADVTNYLLFQHPDSTPVYYKYFSPSIQFTLEMIKSCLIFIYFFTSAIISYVYIYNYIFNMVKYTSFKKMKSTFGRWVYNETH